jgi:hypothetical protein
MSKLLVHYTMKHIRLQYLLVNYMSTSNSMLYVEQINWRQRCINVISSGNALCILLIFVEDKYITRIHFKCW